LLSILPLDHPVKPDDDLEKMPDDDIEKPPYDDPPSRMKTSEQHDDPLEGSNIR
jgi:hypothetical protein